MSKNSFPNSFLPRQQIHKLLRLFEFSRQHNFFCGRLQRHGGRGERREFADIPVEVYDRGYFAKMMMMIMEKCIHVLGLEKEIRARVVVKEEFPLQSILSRLCGNPNVVFDRRAGGGKVGGEGGSNGEQSSSCSDYWMMVSSQLSLLMKSKKSTKTVIETARNHLVVPLASLAEGVLFQKDGEWRRMGITTDLFTWVFTMTEENPDKDFVASLAERESEEKEREVDLQTESKGWRIYEKVVEHEDLETIARLLCLFLKMAIIEGDKSAAAELLFVQQRQQRTEDEGKDWAKGWGGEKNDEVERKETVGEDDAENSTSFDIRGATREFAEQIDLVAENDGMPSDSTDEMESNSKVAAWLASSSSFFFSSSQSSSSSRKQQE